MKKNLHSIVSVALLICLLFLAACQNTSETSESSESSSVTPSTSETEEEITLVFWDMAWGSDVYYDAMNDLIVQFETENPGIKIDYQTLTWDGYVQNFTAAVASDSGPDFSTGGGSLQHLMAEMGEILYLDDIIAEWEKTGEINDFPAGSLESMRYDGHQIGIPWNYDPLVLFYNIEHFEAAGIEKIPTNSNELYEALVKLKEAGYGGLTTDVLYSWCSMAFWQLFAFDLAEEEGTVGFYKDGEVLVNTKAGIEAFAFIRKLADEGLISQAIASYDNPDATKDFVQGNSSILFENINVESVARESNPELLDKIGIMKPFATGIGNPSNQIMGFSDTKYPEETMKAIAWFSAHEAPLFTDTGLAQYPVRISIANDSAIQDRWQIDVIVNEVLPLGKAYGYPNESLFPEFQTIMGNNIMVNAVQRAILTDDPVEDIAAEVQTEIEKIMAGS